MIEQIIDQDVSGNNNIFSAVGDVYVYNSPPPLLPDDVKKRRELEVLVAKVEEFWIEGVLKSSLHNVALFDLGSETQEDAVESVENPLGQILELPNQPGQPISPDKKIVEIFDSINKGLLILGEPGSGKTTTLLQLTRGLIHQFKVDASFGQPVPVVFNLSTWTRGHLLVDWLVEQLLAIYKIPRRIGRQWLEDNRLLVMLDGLDEVRYEYQADCVEAINQVIEEFGLPGLAISSRFRDYVRLPNRLKLNGAVRLQPLTTEQIDEYLIEAGDDLNSLRITLQDDNTLKELAESPLTLGIMTLAYKGMSVHELADLSLNTIEARRKHLFDTYVKRLLERKGQREKIYTDEQTIEWLSWLADRLIWHKQTIFLVEHLQPSWLSSWTSRYIYLIGSRLGGAFSYWLIGILLGGLIAGLIYGVGGGVAVGLLYFESTILAVIGLFIGLIIGPILGIIYGLISAPCYLLLFASISGFCIGLYDSIRLKRANEYSQQGPTPFYLAIINVIKLGIFICFAFIVVYGIVGFIIGIFFRELSLGAFIGAMIGLILVTPNVHLLIIFGLRNKSRSITTDIRTVEALSWSWGKALKGSIYGIIIGLICELIGILIYYSVILFATRFTFELSDLPLNAWLGALLGQIPILLVSGLMGMAFGGFDGKILDTKVKPNQGIQLSLRNALFSLVLSGLFFTLISVTLWIFILGEAAFLDGNSVLIGGLIGGVFGFLWGLLLSACFGLLTAMWYGGLDVVQHYTLRFICWQKNYTPRNYIRFLNYAVDRIFLHKVGGGYIFSHRLLMEHFAKLEQEPLPVDSITNSSIKLFPWRLVIVGLAVGFVLSIAIMCSLGASKFYESSSSWRLTINSWRLIAQGESLVQEGYVEEAILKYQEAQTINPVVEITADSWNKLCWFGSLWERPADVMHACEEAVRLDPSNGGYRDSRGVARALLGDYEGAIEDFEFFVEWARDNSANEQYGQKRKAWIIQLQVGNNPFKESTLQELKNEE